MCCSEGFICGGMAFSGCPVGACCYVGYEGKVIPDAGSAGVVPQRPE
jgi:hypothetical protein